MATAQTLVKEITSPAYTEIQIVKVSGVKSTGDLWSLGADKKLVSREFLDGNGRVIQQIYQNAGTGTKNDLIKFTEYNSAGTISVDNLPYAATTQLQFQANALTDQKLFYSTGNTSGKYAKDNAPYAQTLYENSPIQRLLQEGSYGTNWQIATGKIKNYTSRTNTTTDQVRLLKPDGSSTAFYGQGLLDVNEVTDAEGLKTLVFTDKAERVILKRQLVDETIQGTYYQYKDTYYVYAYSGPLNMVLPPKVVATMKTNNWVLSANDVANNVYRYIYDDEGKVIQRKTPSSALIYIIYDKLNRPVLVQNARLRAENKWNFIKYDLYNRPVMEGIIQDNTRNTYDLMRTYAESFDYTNPAIAYYEKKAATIEGYTNVTFPTVITAANVLSVYYYDSYDLDGNGTDDYTYTTQGLGADEPVQGSAQGNLTVVKNKIIQTQNWMQKVMFYNTRGEMIQEKKNNIISLAVNDSRTIVYNFDGTVKKKISKKNTGVEQKTVESFTYDIVSRPKEIIHQVNSQPAVTIAQYSYNELGQLTDKNLGLINGGQPISPNVVLGASDAVSSGQQKEVIASNSIILSSGFQAASGSNFTASIVSSAGYLQSVDYQYNIRGWLTKINNPTLTADNYNEESNDVFGMEILYEQQGDIGNTAKFNGLISGVKWRSKMVNNDYDNLERSYTYNYDKLGQLRDALFKAKQGSTWNYMLDAFSEKEIKYDLNGNITALRRFMWNKPSGTATEVDQLSYTYSALSQDQLVKVEDPMGSAGGIGFKNLVNESTEYEYDLDGNLLKDKNKGLSYLYNEINKVAKISYLSDPTKYISFEYNSSGERVRKSVYQGATLIKQISYLDEFIYEGGVISYVSNTEGRVRLAQGITKYEYFIKDYLGNVRISFEDNNGQALVRQESSYYAFGMQHTPIMKPSNANTDLFNGGSEWLSDFDNDPDLYSTFFRTYDPVLGRFNGVDPMADKYADYSVYNFALNNPISLNDPTGGDPLPDFDRIISELLRDVNGNGGTIDAGGNIYKFTSKEDAFNAGVKLNDIFGTWDFTERGNKDRSIANFIKGDPERTGILLREVNINRRRISAKFVSRLNKQRANKERKSIYSAIWNSPLARVIVPDFISVGGGFSVISGGGTATSFQATWVLRGRDASWKPAITNSIAIGGGYSVDLTLDLGTSRYLGPVSDINRGMLVTNTFNGGQPTYWGSAGIAAGGKIGITGEYTPTSTGWGIVGTNINIGGGLPAGIVPGNAAGGISNTYMIYDFK